MRLYPSPPGTVVKQLRPGDILVQYRGEPWCFAAWLATGMPHPHAQLVTAVLWDGTVRILENSADGIHEKDAYNLHEYIVVRPLADAATIAVAIAWARAHIGEGYGYGRLGAIAFGYRLGLRTRPGMDDDTSQDGRKKVCSETIAMAFYRAGQATRSGYDAVPGVQDRDTLPGDFLKSPSVLILGVAACP